MNVNDIINKAVSLLNLDITVATGSTDARLSRLVSALGVAYMQLITEFAPLEKKMSISFTNGEYSLSSITANKFFDAISIENSKGNKVKFRVCDGKIYADVDNETCTLRYHCTPNTYPALGGQIDISPLITEALFAKGVAAEYALENGMYDEAIAFDKSYKDGLANVFSAHSVKVASSVSRWWV